MIAIVPATPERSTVACRMAAAEPVEPRATTLMLMKNHMIAITLVRALPDIGSSDYSIFR